MRGDQRCSTEHDGPRRAHAGIGVRRAERAAAAVWIQHPTEVPYARTLSDRSGGYYVCGLGPLPMPVWLAVTKDGYETTSFLLESWPASQTLDLDIVRSP
jgi:hypothetical protein